MTPATATSLTLWQQLKEAAVPVIAYWALTLFTYLAMSAVVVATQGVDVGSVGAMIVFLAAWVPGVALGQLLAFLRVRTWLVLLFGAFCWVASIAVGAGLGAVAGDVGVLIAAFLFLLPIATTGGLWSLETNRAVWSTWLPILFTSIAVIVWAEAHGNDAAWFAGNKWAIWDLATLFVLGITVVLTLVYLVSRETHRLALWRRGPRAPLTPTLVEKGAARPRITLLGGCLMLVVAGAVTLGTAVVSPYLWRTGERETETTEQPEPPPEPQDPPKDGCEQEPTSGPETPPPEPQDAEQMGEKVVQAAQEAAGAVCSALAFAVLMALGAVIGGPPLRRLFIVRHLRDPLWRVSPTTRIEQGWRLVEIALADAGVRVTPGEDAAGLARRAAPVLARLSPVEVHGLEDAAAVADRVRFGLGVGPGDVAVMERFSAWAYDTVWERLSDREQVRCMYRGL